jgi:hypothetical protein
MAVPLSIPMASATARKRGYFRKWASANLRLYCCDFGGTGVGGMDGLFFTPTRKRSWATCNATQQRAAAAAAANPRQHFRQHSSAWVRPGPVIVRVEAYPARNGHQHLSPFPPVWPFPTLFWF